ncbi:MAG: VCBS repeat-containing protein, partial [Caldilineaceae bacterium]|nr:VCBS repeat-containing protein [Caldilineaceae bacterium]
MMATSLIFPAALAQAQAPRPEIRNEESTTTRAVNWTHLSTVTNDLPLPSGAAQQSAAQQSAAVSADIDNDGTQDFAIAMRNSEGASVVWYRRHATGWDTYLIEAAALDIEAGGAWYDIDGDGDQDLVLGGDFRSNQLWWWENPYPNFQANVPWQRYLIKASGHPIHHDQLFGDFDGDGAVELVFWNQASWDSANLDAQLLIAEIPANPKATQAWPTAAIYQGFGEGLAQADIDRDGTLDLVIGGYWLKHAGGTDYTAHVIDATQSAARVAVGDVNQDNFSDIVMVNGDSKGPLRWYECTGDPRVADCWVAHDLLNVEVDHGHSLALGDVNQDGNLDIFVAEMRLHGKNEDARMWSMYGDGTGNFITEEVAVGLGNHESQLVDLDGDGDLDILGKPYNWETPRLDLWLNEGPKEKERWERAAIDSERPWRAIFITTADINGDALADIVTGGWWYQNPGADSS